MAYCPNCEAAIDPSAVSCEHCDANFSAADGWRPKDARETSADRRADCLRTTYTLLAIALLAVAFAIALPFWHPVLVLVALLYLVLFFGGAVIVTLISRNYKQSAPRSDSVRFRSND